MKRTSVRAALLAVSAAAIVACSARGGNPQVDANGDGILDSNAGNVRAPDVIQQQAPSSPVGTVTGKMRDAFTGDPLSGVTVTINSASLTPARADAAKPPVLTTTTGDAGEFTLKNVPPGNNFIVFAKDGYVQVNSTVGVMIPILDGPTNNTVTNMLDIFMVQSSDQGVKVPIQDPDGAPATDGTSVTAHVAAGFEASVSSGPLSTLDPIGFTTMVVKTEGGIATFPNIPNFTACTGNFGTAVIFQIGSCGVDANGDGVVDYTIGSKDYTKADFCKSAGILDPPSASSVFTGGGAFGLAAVSGEPSNIAVSAAGTFPPLLASEPITFITNAPVNLGASSVFVVNAYAHDKDASTLDTAAPDPQLAYDNSTPNFPGEGILIDPFAYGGTLGLDGSQRIITVPPPSGGWPLGSELILRAVISPASRATSAGTAQTAFAINGSFRTVDPMGALTIKKVQVYRASTAGNPMGAAQGAMTRVALLLDRVIAAPAGIRLCIDTNVIGAPDANAYGTADPLSGVQTLRTGRCPTLPLKDADATVLSQRAVLRARASEGAALGLGAGSGTVLEFDIADFTPSMPFDTAPFKLLINQPIDGRPDSALPVLDSNGAALATQALAFSVDVNAAQKGGNKPDAATTNFCLSDSAATPCP